MSNNKNWHTERMNDIWKMRGNPTPQVNQPQRVSEMMKHYMTRPVAEHIKPNAIVQDAEGKTFFIEQCDPYSFSALAIDSEGHQVRLNTIGLKLTETTSQAGDGLGVGSKVQVTKIDPNFNQYRTHATEPDQAPGVEGQTGNILFAYYPVNGVTMYRVLLPQGAKKDFTAAELSKLSEDVAEAGEVIQGVQQPAAAPAKVKKDPNAANPTGPQLKPGQRVLHDKKVGVVTCAMEDVMVCVFDDGSEGTVPTAELKTVERECTKCENYMFEGEEFCGRCGTKITEMVAMAAVPSLGMVSSTAAARPVNTEGYMEGSRIDVDGRLGVITGFPTQTETERTARVLFDDGREQIVSL